ncbi:MAG: sporulation transcriptional regulator SpoIIID [Clostridia bacterium]|nr:sporulation transcriptional regulator SpoIIID [Clostridia bacterium]
MFYECDERARELGNYIIQHNATVRQAAAVFKISKSTVHTEVTITNGLCGW